MTDRTLLRKMARDSIANGSLPNGSPEETWGGPGTGTRCALCDAPVTKDELEFEVDIGGDRYHLHLACFSAWEAERRGESGNPRMREPVADAEPQSASAKRAEASSGKHRGLPDRSVDGNMADNGGERAYKPGAA